LYQNIKWTLFTQCIHYTNTHFYPLTLFCCFSGFFHSRLACDWLLWRLFTLDLPVSDCYDVFIHMTYLWLTVMTSLYTWLTCDWLLWRLYTHDLPVSDCYDVFIHMTYLWVTVMTSFYTWLTCDWLLWCLYTYDLPVTDCYDVFIHTTYLWLTVMTSFYRCVSRSHSVLFLLHVTIYRQYISSNNHLQWIKCISTTFQTWIYGCHDNDNINYIIHIMVTWSFDALQ
jgi:hypothetical protein